MTDQRWFDSVRGRALQALTGCAVENRWPRFESYTDRVFELAQQVLKQKKDWLTTSNIYSIFHKQVSELLGGRFPPGEKVEGRLTDLFEHGLLAEAAEAIARFIASIPRTYLHYVPLPGINNGEWNLQLSEDVSLTIFREGETPPGGFQRGLLSDFVARLQQDQAYVVVKERGFAGASIEDSAPSRALSKLKQLTHLGMIRGTLRLKDVSQLGYGLGLGGHRVPDLNMTVFEEVNPDRPCCSFLLPINVSQHIDRIELHAGNKRYLEASDRGSEAVAEYLKRMFARPVLLLDSDEEGAEFVRAAIEWAFEAASSDNDTVSGRGDR